MPPIDGFPFLNSDKSQNRSRRICPSDDVAFMDDSQVSWGIEALNGAVSEAAWRSKPSSGLVATDDHMTPPAARRPCPSWSEQGGPASDPYLAAKGVRDIASGVVVFVLLAAGKPHALGRYLAAYSITPIGDAINVLRGNGPKTTAYGVHGTTAAAMPVTAALLLSGPE